MRSAPPDHAETAAQLVQGTATRDSKGMQQVVVHMSRGGGGRRARTGEGAEDG